MPDVITGNTQTGPTKAEVISAYAQKELKHAAMLSPYAYDVSRFAQPGADSISFPKLTSFIAEKRASGAKGTIQALNSSKDTLSLSESAFIAWLIDANDKIQTTLDWDLECAGRAGGELGRTFDADLVSAAKTAAGLSLTGAITRDKVLQMREFIKKNDGVLAQTVMVVSTTVETALLKIDEFTRADVIYGNTAVSDGLIGKLYGMPVFSYNGLADGDALIWEKNGLAYGFQKVITMDEQKAIEYGTGAMLKAMDNLYGVSALQKGEKGLGATLSPLITKLTAV